MIKLTASDTAFAAPFVESAKKSVRAVLLRQDLGFHQVTSRDALWSQSQKRAAEVRKTADELVVFGIGGSSLGAISLLKALSKSESVHFFENVDSLDFWRRLEALKVWDKLHFCVISKSGNTVETLSQVSFLLQFAEQKKLSLKDRFTVVSENKESPLTQWAHQEKIPVLEVPLDIGGRFSVLTPVGLFPAAFAGVHVEALKDGARLALKEEDSIAQLVSFGLAGFSAKRGITLFWSYSNALRDFGLWIQQLWAESLAKKVNRKGDVGPFVSTPVPLLGANDQHSVLQQVVEGIQDKTCVFLRVKDSEGQGPTLSKTPFAGLGFLEGKTMGALLAAEADATREVLQREKIPSLTLKMDHLDERTLGFLFMYFQIAVGALGEALNIDAFNQPGVELGKRLAKENLSK